jgi:hypothetical protein
VTRLGRIKSQMKVGLMKVHNRKMALELSYPLSDVARNERHNVFVWSSATNCIVMSTLDHNWIYIKAK